MTNSRLRKTRLKMAIDVFRTLTEEEKEAFMGFVNESKEAIEECEGDKECEIRATKRCEVKYGLAHIGIPETFIFGKEKRDGKLD